VFLSGMSYFLRRKKRVSTSPVLDAGNELVAGQAAPGGHTLASGWVVCLDLEDLAAGEKREALFDQRRQVGAGRSRRVEDCLRFRYFGCHLCAVTVPLLAVAAGSMGRRAQPAHGTVVPFFSRGSVDEVVFDGEKGGTNAC